MKFPFIGLSSKKYKCEMCNKQFKTEKELRDHEQNVHVKGK
jgi:C2H2-type zinc finger protein